MKTTWTFRKLLAWRDRPRAGRPEADAAAAEATDRLVSALVDGAPEGLPDRTKATTAGESLAMARLIRAIREAGADDAPLAETQVNAIMAALRREAEGASRTTAWRDRLGMIGGFLASTATLTWGLLLLGGASSLPVLETGTPSSPALALAVAAAAALVSLFVHRESTLRQPARGTAPVPSVLAIAVLANASCAPDTPGGGEATEIEIPATALTVFEEGDELYGVRDVIESGEAIWALTEAPPFLRAYDHGGRILADFGTTGEGPGELRNPWTLSATDPAGSVIVWDHGTRRRSVFDAAGDFVSSVPAPSLPNAVIRGDIRNVTFGDPFRVAEDRGELRVATYAGGLTQPDDFWGGRILLIEDGREPQTLVDFSTDLPGAANRLPLMGLTPVPLWDLCPDGRIAVLDPVGRALHLYAADGTEERRIPLPWAARPLSRDERLGYVRAMMTGETRGTDVADEEVNAAAEGMLAQAGDQLATEAPFGVDLRCAPGRAWIQEFDGSSHALGYGRAWRTVALDDETPGDGAPDVRQIVFPDGFVPWRLTDSMAIGVVTDDVHLQRIAVVRLEFTQWSR